MQIKKYRSHLWILCAFVSDEETSCLQFLSMKLAAVNPRVEFNMDNLFRRDVSLEISNVL